MAEIACIVGVLGLLTAFAVHIERAVDSEGGWLGLGTTIVVAYLASDALSGLVHWAGDTIGDEGVPFLGPNFIRPFREHHLDQGDIARHDFVETNGNNCIVIVGPLALAFLLMPARPGLGFFTAAFVAFLALFVVATNQFHKWAHTERPPRFARLLQRFGLILSPRHHQKHHAVPHDRHYCITVGWMNPVLNQIRFFRMLEWLIARVRPTWLHIDERRRHAADLLARAQDEAAAGFSGPKQSISR
jgi:hypothetical protein